MRPIAQTFYINEPGGADAPVGVYITRIDVYFKAVNASRGITLEIRETQNGVPTPNVVPFGSVRLSQNSIPPRGDMLYAFSGSTVKTYDEWAAAPFVIGIFPTSSSNASAPTAFEFATPVFLQSNKSYAFVLLPDGGCDGFEVWSADYTGGTILNTGTGSTTVTIGNDTITGTPVTDNNDTGDLFLSSNDRTWDPIITEDIKFEIFRAEFTASSGEAYFNTLDEDWIQFTDIAGKGFKIREKVVFSNGYYNFAKLNVSSSDGVSAGHTITQGGFTGIVANVVSTSILLSNTTGAFAAGSASDTTSSTSLNITSVAQSVGTTFACNVITVPDSSIYATDQVIFVQTNNRSNSQVVAVTGKPGSTTISVNATMQFTDTSALIGRVLADGILNAGISTQLQYKDTTYSILDNVTSTQLVNLANYTNNQIIGLFSGTSATIRSVDDRVYNTIHFKYNYQQLPNTLMEFAFSSFYNDKTNPLNIYPETDFISVKANKVTDLRDAERIATSRSNSLGNLPVGRQGNAAITLRSTMATANSKISPVIDSILTDVSIYENILNPKYQYDGTYLRIVENTESFSPGDIVSQSAYGNTTIGTIVEANTTQIRVSNVNGKFINGTDFTTDKSAAGHINVSEAFNESMDNGYFRASRYISKNVVLADGQDSEDIRVYLGAYRPANTDFLVYAKIQSSLDHDVNDKSWTKLQELSSPALISSKINTEDFVELIYGFNQGTTLYSSNTAGNTTYSNVYVQSTELIANNDIVYFNIEPAKFSGHITGTTLTVDSMVGGTGYTGTIALGQKIYGLGVTAGTYISAFIPSTGGTGGTGTYTVSTSHTGTGTITMTSGETAFNVREVIYVIDGNNLTLDRPLSTCTGNASMGHIPGADSTSGAFLYDNNNNIVRYCTSSDAVFDNFIQFTIKLVPTADSKAIVPAASDIRVLALQV